MGHNKSLGTSPEIEENLKSIPGKIVKGVGHEAHEAINSLWGQMLGGSHDKGSKNGEFPPSYDEAVPPPPSYPEAAADSPPKYVENMSPEQKRESTRGEILFQLGLDPFRSSGRAPQNAENTVESRRPGIDHHGEYFESIRNFDKKADSRDERQIREKIQSIQEELKQLVASVRELKHHFGDVAVATPPQNPGKYHENFFEWLLIMVKQARQKVENSSSWLGTVKGKGKGKGDYWDRAEKEGTTFTQSMDRSASTSVG